MELPFFAPSAEQAAMSGPFKSQAVLGKEGEAQEKPVVGSSRRLPHATPVLTVVIPVYNEAGTIDELLRRVIAAPYEKQVLVVDDGSTDGTAQALEKWEGYPQLVLLQHSRNRGKGAAIRTGLDHAECPYTVVQDADLEYDPNDYAAVIEPLLNGRAEVVYGSRYLRPPDGRRRRWSLSRCAVSALNVCVRWLYGARLTDEATCYKAFSTTMLRAMDLECERFEFCPEVTAKACRLGARILEVPIRYDARTRRAGKKIRWTDGLQALATLWRWRKWRPE